LEERVLNGQRAVIVGAGPAGLTAAFELLERTGVRPVVLEASDALGGLARTVNHNGNRIDIGGHRFFSKSDRVLDWWFRMLPPEATGLGAFPIRYKGASSQIRTEGGADPSTTDEILLVRSRKSRIYHLRKLFDYPFRLSPHTLANLGALRALRIGASYLRARLQPIREERNLEQFFVNRFGRELYRTFFESYTEKVWGVPCRRISAAWGAQRVKGLSVTKALLHALAKPFRNGDMAQSGTETSLIERFLYPKFGPGQMWETCARRVEAKGGCILKQRRAERFLRDGNRITAVVARDLAGGAEEVHEGDLFFSTMPVKDLVRGMEGVPAAVREVAEGLVYRDFITVGLLVDGLRIREKDGSRVRDNWIYIQEPDVRVGRLQIFNNWSPWLVRDPSKTWIGLEYFCDEGDELWTLPDDAMADLAAAELVRIGILDSPRTLDRTVLRVQKAYPAYFGSYDRFGEVRAWVDGIENLFLVGRNGMHRYNNQDHSMLAAMTVVDNLVAGRRGMTNVWDVNTEQAYHERRPERRAGSPGADGDTTGRRGGDGFRSARRERSPPA
jgi:protoporphyrinogen oxidase